MPPTSSPSDAHARATAAARSCAELIRQLAGHHPSAVDLMPSPRETREVRACLQEYAKALCVAGVSPEAMIVLVKQLVFDAARDAGVSSRALTQAAVTWAVEAYFG